MGSLSVEASAEAKNGNGAGYHYAQGALREPRPIRVVMIGAGNSDVGGTWFENRYPGCSCDVPAHGYTYTWEGNPNWSQAYVSSRELFDYYKGRAVAYGVFDHLFLNHMVTGAKWEGNKGTWAIEVTDTQTGNSFTDEAEIFINAGGFLNKWRWPDIPGLEDFSGFRAHSACWDDSLDFTDKRVAVIGSGSSGIQIVPTLEPIVKKMVTVIRSPVWITPEIAADLAPEGRDTVYTEEQKKKWAEDPQEFLRFRKIIERSMNHLYEIHFKGSDMQRKMTDTFTRLMKDRLKNKPELADRLIPKFGVGCRRQVLLTPGKGYLEALCSDKVEVAFGSVARITKSGLVMQDGTTYEVDAIICATGFDTSFKPRFPLIGSKGTDLRDIWKKEPASYLSVTIPDFPNYFVIGGPNFTLANGVFLICLETTFKYVFQAIEKIQQEGIKSVVPKREAMNDFLEHKDSIMNDMVWTSTCRSWYKNGTVDGKVWGIWPGSSIHFIEIMAAPRWEDYDIEYLQKNRFNFFGIGQTLREKRHGDLSYYLSERGYSYDDQEVGEGPGFLGKV
ncbi:hypothetical protein H2204_011002 [Knufia peltigerae]|uniref:Uncharacterized protein n=1 Tax=Knufia peltigerae TaxID=1002370 RepID=A0AA39CTL4_9EURO|nr:hypothetical protein H2204_011002 [Knufia peltigerae]